MLRLPSRLARVFPEFPGEVRRPFIFSLLFWTLLVGNAVGNFPYVVGVLYSSDASIQLRPEVGFAASTLASILLAAVWFVLPWDPRAGSMRKLTAPAFLAGMFALGLMLPTAALLLYPVAVANAVFLFRFGWGIAYSAVVLAVVFTDVFLLAWLRAAPSQPWEDAAGIALVATVLFALVAVFIIGVCVSIVEANRRREEVEEAHEELRRYSERVKELTISEERARMSREMHDSLGHYLTVINLGLENARRFKSRKPDAAWDEVEEAKDLTLEALSETRRWVRAMKPLSLEDKAGSEAMAALARSFEGTGMEVRFAVEGEERRLESEAELTLYRALQEGLVNAVRHSKASRVRAKLSFAAESVRLTVADDGEGAPEKDVKEGGFGLSALAERARALGGTSNAGDAPGGGFVLEVELPVELPVEDR